MEILFGREEIVILKQKMVVLKELD